MTEIWAAANATGSDVMMRWWTPEALYQTFLTTEAEFQRVSFPPPTQDCVEARVTPEVRCEGTLEERLGDPKGVCDDPSHSLLRLITKSLREASMDPSIPAETRSPGYDMVSSLTLSELQIGKIFDYWLKRGSDKWNFDPRDAACRWLSENLHLVKPMIPKTYPRIIRENEDYYNEPLFYVSLFFAMAATVLVFAMMACVHYNCKKPSVARAQVEFLWMLLWGLLMVATASVVLVIPATDASCTSVAWLADMGFTLSLVPLIVKMAAINTLMQAAKSMRRVVVKRERLFGVVFGLCFLVFGFLLTWTIMDPPRQSAEYEISDEVTGNDETVVIMSYHCESDSDVWRMATAGWNAILLLIATIFTFQTRKVRREINETQSLIFLIYSHCIFVALRCILFSLEGVLSPWNVTRYLSLIYSIDTISACCIYFAPKVLAQEELTMEQRLASSRRSRFSETRPSALSKMHSYNRNGSSFARDQNGSVTESPLHDDTTDSDSPVDHDNTDSEAHLDCIVESDSEKEEAEESTDGSQSQPVAFDFLT